MNYDPHKSFGYPVLRPLEPNSIAEDADYIEAAFQASIGMLFDVKKAHVLIDYKFATSLSELKSKINTGVAGYFLRVECPATYLAITEEVKEHGLLRLPGDDMRGDVMVTGFIVAKCRMKIQSDKINPEFGFKEFTVEPGFVLALAFPETYYLEKDTFRPITSIFDYREDNNLPEGRFMVDLDEDYVQIRVHPEQKKTFKVATDVNDESSLHGQAAFLSSVALTAVILMLKKLEEDDESVKEKKWAKVLMSKPEYDATGDHLTVAQDILKNPIKRSNRACFSRGK